MPRDVEGFEPFEANYPRAIFRFAGADPIDAIPEGVNQRCRRGFAPGGATHDDLRLMRANTSPHIQVKAAGGVRTLDALLDVMALGVTRIGATATKTIIDDFRARKAGTPTAAPAAAATEGGY